MKRSWPLLHLGLKTQACLVHFSLWFPLTGTHAVDDNALGNNRATRQKAPGPVADDMEHGHLRAWELLP